jgi:predicted dehydrogenase
MKTAIIGLGRMGLRHVEAAQLAGLTIVGCADLSPDALKAAGEKGVASDALFTDAFEMLSKVGAELVLIATTAPSHEPFVQGAIDGGAKAILCEKPMATSIDDCANMIAAAAAAGCKLAINHQMRFMDQYTIPKAMCDSEEFGGLASIQVSAGNFGVSMNGSHYIEMFRYMTGESVETVQAWFQGEKLSNPRGPQFEDRAGSFRLTTPSGKRFYMDAGSDQGHGMHVTYMCRNGRIDIDELTGDLRAVVRLKEHADVPTTRYGMPHRVEVQKITPADSTAPTLAVIHALIAGENYPSGEDGLNTVRALVAAYASNESGSKPVRVDDPALDTKVKFPWA